MKKFLFGGLVTLIVVLVMAFAIAWTGAISFAADAPHADAATQLIDWIRERAVAKASADIIAPANLSDPERIRRGAGNYAAMCADCHLGPGQADTEIRKGLYPVPPDLARIAAAGDSAGADARRFWIIKHGIKGSGMAAWSKGGMDDESIWDLTAFLRQLPQLSESAYAELVAHSEGHSHGGLGHDAQHTDHPAKTDAMVSPKDSGGHPPHTHEHAGKPHSH